MAPADPYDAIRDGYFYGTDQLTELRLEVETIWARKWTSEFMPPELKTVLGVPIEQPKQAQDAERGRGSRG